jgi:hypothetical protein
MQDWTIGLPTDSRHFSRACSNVSARAGAVAISAPVRTIATSKSGRPRIVLAMPLDDSRCLSMIPPTVPARFYPKRARTQTTGRRAPASADFGTGYVSLTICKASRSTRSRLTGLSSKGTAEGAGLLNIVRPVAALAKGLGMATTADGVETKEQLATIKSEGCTEMQGYLFSRPFPAHELKELFILDRMGDAAQRPDGRPAERFARAGPTHVDFRTWRRLTREGASANPTKVNYLTAESDTFLPFTVTVMAGSL